MNFKIEQIRFGVASALAANQQIGNPLDRLTADIAVIEPALVALRQFIKDEKLLKREDEILFFKNIKPEILAFKLEAGIRYNLYINKPIGTNEVQIKYFEEELKSLQSYMRLHTFHYQYYKNGFTDLDHLYFIRDAGPLFLPVTELTDIDDEFSTPMSYLFAKFIAFENSQYFILEQIAEVKNPNQDLQIVNNKISPELKWTGDAINAVELAYGLWLTGQLNHGNASLNQIVRWMESDLHISIGNIQRRFIEIGRRKRLSPTKFIDQMKDSVIQKLENGYN